MKKIFLMLALAAGAQFTASAQQAMTTASGPQQAQAQGMRSPEERAQMQADRMQKQFGLSDDQKKQVVEINVKYQKQADAMRTDASAPDARRGKMEGMRKMHDAEIMKVLTPDQTKKFNEMRDNRAKMMQQRQNGQAPMQQTAPMQAPAANPAK